jgi:hypothetical protein
MRARLPIEACRAVSGGATPPVTDVPAARGHLVSPGGISAILWAGSGRRPNGSYVSSSLEYERGDDERRWGDAAHGIRKGGGVARRSGRASSIIDRALRAVDGRTVIGHRTDHRAARRGIGRTTRRSVSEPVRPDTSRRSLRVREASPPGFRSRPPGTETGPDGRRATVGVRTGESGSVPHAVAGGRRSAVPVSTHVPADPDSQDTMRVSGPVTPPT